VLTAAHPWNKSVRVTNPRRNTFLAVVWLSEVVAETPVFESRFISDYLLWLEGWIIVVFIKKTINEHGAMLIFNTLADK
jgi:hypothetical protein